MYIVSLAIGALALLFLSALVGATPFFFSTGNPDDFSSIRRATMVHMGGQS